MIWLLILPSNFFVLQNAQLLQLWYFPLLSNHCEYQYFGFGVATLEQKEQHLSKKCTTIKEYNLSQEEGYTFSMAHC